MSQAVSVNDTTVGWTVGGGVEHAFARNWTAKIEYLHVDLPNTSSTIPPFPGFVNSDVRFRHNMTLEVVRAGINYKF